MIFGKPSEELIILSEEKIDNEKTVIKAKYGKFNITLTSNEPSKEAINNANKAFNDFANRFINRKVAN